MASTIKSQNARAANVPQPAENPAASAHTVVDVIALTARDDFLLELGQCLERTASITPVESSALALAAAAKSRRAQVLVIDSRDFAELRAEVDLLLARAPALSALVFSEQEAEVKVAAALKGSSVFAVLPLPIDARKTAAVFEGAIADAEARRSAARTAGAEARPISAFEARADAATEARAVAPASADTSGLAESAPTQRSAGGGKIKVVALAGAACLVAAAVAAWLLTREARPTTEPPSVAAAPQPASDVDAVMQPLPAVEGNVDELLEQARVAMRERRYTEPADNSALLYYRSAVQADPVNAEALDGLNRLRPVIVANFDELIKAGRYDAAAGALAQLASAVPADPALAELRLRIASARIAEAIEEKDAARATALVSSAEAKYGVPAEQLSKWRSEITRLTDKARQEQQAEQKARESAAAEQKSRDARAAEAAREAQAARERDSAKKLESERAQQAALAAARSAESDAAATKIAGVRVEPRLKRNARPEFPPEAFDKGLSGLVTVAFSVDVEGRTQNVRVESSEPAGVFDKAATNAVKRWRYEPATVDGVPTEADMSISIRFAMPK